LDLQGDFEGTFPFHEPEAISGRIVEFLRTNSA
jgi:hypothetical protein